MSAKHKQTIQELASAPRKVLVRFDRPFDAGSTSGYILDAGPDFFLLATIDDTIHLDGFLCLRYKDVRKLQAPAKFETFVAAALKQRGERIPKAPSVSLASISDLLLTAATAFPLVTVHREKIAPEFCHIGRIAGLNKKQVALLEIGPDALWDDEPRIYSLKEITQVGFGGGYEEALILVGGEPQTSPSIAP
ncbi:hypothetical protein HDF16_000891 [Granulicella aggregans]|uniref:Uncharacterized protein n=1 Tax=Granulicella aggregans TaxID=474949 RepID=A0A7W8E279_9BACT|nr:hypothetical protein [Granulicella aggregans]MBB5056222.1 hypothetical protein [Granulicella aggregans]